MGWWPCACAQHGSPQCPAEQLSCSHFQQDRPNPSLQITNTQIALSSLSALSWLLPQLHSHLSFLFTPSLPSFSFTSIILLSHWCCPTTPLPFFLCCFYCGQSRPAPPSLVWSRSCLEQERAPGTAQTWSVTALCTGSSCPSVGSLMAEKSVSIILRLESSATVKCFVLHGSISHTDAAGLAYRISLFLIRFCSLFLKTSKNYSSIMLPHSPTVLLQRHQPTKSRMLLEREIRICMPGGCFTHLGRLVQLLPLLKQPQGWGDGPDPLRLKEGKLCFAVRKEMYSYRVWGEASSYPSVGVGVPGSSFPSCMLNTQLLPPSQHASRLLLPPFLLPLSILNIRQYFLE